MISLVSTDCIRLIAGQSTLRRASSCVRVGIWKHQLTAASLSQNSKYTSMIQTRSLVANRWPDRRFELQDVAHDRLSLSLFLAYVTRETSDLQSKTTHSTF
jgi:hypothetical protein